MSEGRALRIRTKRSRQDCLKALENSTNPPGLWFGPRKVNGDIRGDAVILRMRMLRHPREPTLRVHVMDGGSGAELQCRFDRMLSAIFFIVWAASIFTAAVLMIVLLFFSSYKYSPLRELVNQAIAVLLVIFLVAGFPLWSGWSYRRDLRFLLKFLVSTVDGEIVPEHAS